MSIETDQAVREMFAALKAGWDASYPGLVVFWPDVAQDGPPQGDPPPPWVRVTVDHVASDERAYGGDRQHHHEETGVLTAQCFQPRGAGLPDQYDLGKVTRNSLRNRRTPGGVRFSNVRISEIGADGIWWQTNVLANFRYDQFTRSAP